MADEVLDPWFVISLGVAFLIGLISLFVFFWFRTTYRESALKSKSGEMTSSERLEYYEKQLIDMKIRLDALEIVQNTMMQNSNTAADEQHTSLSSPTITSSALVSGLTQLLAKVSENADNDTSQEGQKDVISITTDKTKEPDSKDSVPKIEFSAYPNPVDYVLHLITNNITTSRDIQITMKKSREHTSRLLKKMYEDGYLQRNKGNRPYTYSITQKGTERLQQASSKD